MSHDALVYGCCSVSVSVHSRVRYVSADDSALCDMFELVRERRRLTQARARKTRNGNETGVQPMQQDLQRFQLTQHSQAIRVPTQLQCAPTQVQTGTTLPPSSHLRPDATFFRIYMHRISVKEG